MCSSSAGVAVHHHLYILHLNRHDAMSEGFILKSLFSVGVLCAVPTICRVFMHNVFHSTFSVVMHTNTYIPISGLLRS